MPNRMEMFHNVEEHKSPEEVSSDTLRSLNIDIPHAQFALHQEELMTPAQTLEERPSVLYRDVITRRREYDKTPMGSLERKKILQDIIHDFPQSLDPGELENQMRRVDSIPDVLDGQKGFVKLIEGVVDDSMSMESLKNLFDRDELNMSSYNELQRLAEKSKKLLPEDKEKFLDTLHQEQVAYDDLKRDRVPALQKENGLPQERRGRMYMDAYKKHVEQYNAFMQRIHEEYSALQSLEDNDMKAAA